MSNIKIVEKHNKSNIGALCVIISAVLFGLMPLFAKIAYNHGSNPYNATVERYFFSAAALYIVLKITRQPVRLNKAHMFEVFLLSIFFALTSLLLYASYDYIGSGLATTLHFTYPVLVIVIMALVFRIKTGVKEILCLALSIAGIVLFYSPTASQSATGIIFAAASGLTYAIYIVMLGARGIKELNVVVITFWLSAFSALEIGAVAAFSHKLTIDLEWQGWLAQLFLGLLSTALGAVLFQKGIKMCGEVKASLLSTFEPVTGVIIGMVAFGETLTLKIGAGITLILLSAVILVTGSKKRRYKLH